MSSSEFTNRLAQEKSPYLLQHAHNPVDWYPYGEEAFRRARELDRPIFLSIGYSTCHWCHVMERESFENPEVAAVLNQHFINVKVDREERPDVDQIYMQAVMAMAGQGGWPLSAWLTPDLVPFYGGTYFPPEARMGRPGFAQLCEWLSEMWRNKREEVLAQGDKLRSILGRADGGKVPEEGADPDAAGKAARRDLEEAFDARHGGFGGAPKFPRPATLAFLLHRAEREEDPQGLAMVEKTLEMMWRGGLYDHVGGGFARYSVDARWLVPHFEKMLYDNAQLVEVYLDAHLATGREDFAAIARDTLVWVEREMTHAEGGFYSAQDADSEGEEGRFYVFTPADLEAALGAEDAAFVSAVHGVTEKGNFEGKSILFWPDPVPATAERMQVSQAELHARLAPLRERLYAWREQRVRPGLDDKVLTAWNGLMIAAAARAGRVLGEERWTRMAERAATFVLEHLRSDDGALLRRWREGEARFAASLDDHAFLAHGLLTLFGATGEARWFAAARALVKLADERFAAEDGGYWYAEPSDDLIVRMKESYDGALPSSNGMQALLLARIAAIEHAEDREARVLAVTDSFAGPVHRTPEAHPYLVMAAREAREGARTLTVHGQRGEASFERLLDAAHRRFAPGRVILPIGATEAARLAELGVDAGPAASAAGRTEALVCENMACQPFEP